MPELLLGPLLRYVSTTAATVWVEADRRCTVTVRAVQLGRDTTAPTFSFAGHHYALVVLDDLVPGTTTDYEVLLDDQPCWPLPGSPFPPSCIRTYEVGRPVSVMFGSCRSAAPHEPPYTLELDHDERGKGVDALRAAGLRMLDQHPSDWPQLLVMLGDQVYADSSSPGVAERIERTRPEGDGRVPPPGVVADFEEYTWLYHEAWRADVERWVLSVVPSTMIFDDHDMIDDWNISASWVEDIRAEPWWPEHIIGGLVSYWIHQHLGNLSPERIADEGILSEIVGLDDATEHLRRWALESENFTPVPGGYQFSFDRHLGDVHLIVIDARNGRVLAPGRRRMVDEAEWAWIVERALEPADHLLLATSLPVLVPGGLHGIQQWNEALADGERGRLLARGAERLRRALDLEDWAAFDRSFRLFERLLIDVAADRPDTIAPATVSILSGDIHFAYVADVTMPTGCTSTVQQVVCSPIRNALRTRERRVMRFATSRTGRWLGRQLMRWARRGASALSWELSTEPVFHNNIGTMRFTGRSASLVIEVSTAGDDGAERLDIAISR